MKAIEIGERRRAHGLGLAQAWAVGMKVPLQGPRSHGPACTPLVAVTILHGIQGAIEMIVHAIHGIGGARRLRTVVGGGEVGHGGRAIFSTVCASEPSRAMAGS